MRVYVYSCWSWVASVGLQQDEKDSVSPERKAEEKIRVEETRKERIRKQIMVVRTEEWRRRKKAERKIQ